MFPSSDLVRRRRLRSTKEGSQRTAKFTAVYEALLKPRVSLGVGGGKASAKGGRTLELHRQNSVQRQPAGGKAYTALLDLQARLMELKSNWVKTDPPDPRWR